MIAIYSNNFIIDCYIKDLNLTGYQIYHSIDQYLSAAADIKLAFVNHINNYNLPDDQEERIKQYTDGKYFSYEIDQLKAGSDQLFAFDNEMHPYHIDKIFSKHNQPNVFWAIPGQINDDTIIKRENIILWNQHFEMTSSGYRNMIDKLSNIQYNIPKPMFFDALLGAKRIHRDFVNDAVRKSNLQKKILLTYIKDHSVESFSELLWESDIEKSDLSFKRTTDMVCYNGEIIALCRIVPIQIYNQTAYSIVAETGPDNRYSFFTEKTSKCIMGRRLFVMFSGARFLENLRRIGFKTFDTVIDESYDQIVDNHHRWQAAFEQVKKLCEMDQSEVFEKIAPIVEHNYQLLMNTNWTHVMLNQVQQKLILYQI
jgi:hypothetical protein